MGYTYSKKAPLAGPLEYCTSGTKHSINVQETPHRQTVMQHQSVKQPHAQTDGHNRQSPESEVNQQQEAACQELHSYTARP